MFAGWDNFFLMTGSSAAALIGLLFVVASLSAGREHNSSQRATHIYASPLVVHLGLVVALSAITMVPGIPASLAASLSAACALAGLLCSLRVCQQLRSDPPPIGFHWSDFWLYGIGPLLIYLFLAVSATALWFGRLLIPYGLALTSLGLLLLSIRNAWDLVTFLATSADRAA